MQAIYYGAKALYTHVTKKEPEEKVQEYKTLAKQNLIGTVIGAVLTVATAFVFLVAKVAVPIFAGIGSAFFAISAVLGISRVVAARRAEKEQQEQEKEEVKEVEHVHKNEHENKFQHVPHKNEHESKLQPQPNTGRDSMEKVPQSQLNQQSNKTEKNVTANSRKNSVPMSNDSFFAFKQTKEGKELLESFKKDQKANTKNLKIKKRNLQK